MTGQISSNHLNCQQNNLKVYVQVNVDFREDGVMLPREIIWEDGVTYEIDKVTKICQAAAMRAGGQGDRYTIKVRGKESYLFFERSPNQMGNNIGRWFVERRKGFSVHESCFRILLLHGS